MGFPEMAGEAALGGADLILVPAAWREPWGFQYDLSCAARPRQQRVRREREPVGCFYPEASFAIPGHVYGPDGTRVSLPSGITSIGKVDPATSLRWRARYGNTLVKGVDEEPLEIVS